MTSMAKMMVAMMVATMMVACGGDDVDCSFSACGGDPTGSWSIDGVCYDASAFLDEFKQQCPEATGGVSFTAEGTYDLRSDQTFTVSVTTSVRTQLKVPASCIQQAIARCDELNADQLSCRGNPESSCDCTYLQSQDIAQAGTWSTNSSTLTIDDGDTPQDSFYCVDGNTLKIQSIPENPGDAAGTIVLSRN